MEDEMDFALRNRAVSALGWHVDIAIFSASEISGFPVDTVIKICLIKSAKSAMVFPSST
jgi:hypothetical protein